MNQSGIRVSETLSRKFSEADRTVRALKISIIQESLEPNGELEASVSFHQDFDKLSSLLEEDEAAYILFREDNGKFIFISYVGESAKVKDKMLYASTRNTVSRELGSAKFSSSYFATTRQELTYEAFAKHEKGVEPNQQLSEQEKDLRDVKRAETEVVNTQTKRAIVSSGVSFPVSERAQEALNVLYSTSSSRVVSLLIDIKTETIELAVEQEAGLDELPTIIPSDTPRYTFFSWVHEKDGAGVTTQCFLYTCPSQSKVKERMLYSSNRHSIITASGIKIDHKYESEVLDLEDFKSRINPPKDVKSSGFSRPKRPGKK